MTFVFVFLAFIVGMAAFSIASGEQPNVLGYELKTVLSGSMEPSIKTGSIIVVQQTNESHLFEKDDIILSKQKKGYSLLIELLERMAVNILQKVTIIMGLM